MTTITATDALLFELGSLTTPTEIRDAKGNLLGCYTPDAERIRAMYERARAHFDPDQFKRRKEANNSGYTLADVFKHIRSLEPSKCE